MALWTELLLIFDGAYQNDLPNDDLIRRIYAFADACLKLPQGPDASHDPITSVYVVFFEHIPTIRRARDDIYRWLPLPTVANARENFSYHIGNEEFDELVKAISKKQKRG